MDRDLERMGAPELLLELTLSQRRNTRSTRFIAVLLVLLILALGTAAVLLLPLAAQARTALENAQTAIAEFQTTMQRIDAVVSQLESLTGTEDGQSLSEALQSLGAIDFQGLSSGINRLNALLETVSPYLG